MALAVVAPPKVRLGHPGDVHFGLLNSISFIPWFRNDPIGPKGPYPNQTPKKERSSMPLDSQPCRQWSCAVLCRKHFKCSAATRSKKILRKATPTLSGLSNSRLIWS